METDASRRGPDTSSRTSGLQASRAGAGVRGGDSVEALLALAISEPATALAAATSVIAGSADALSLSVAHQAEAVVHRGRGNLDEAIAHGFAALRYARRVDAERQADVLATLGVVLCYAGRSADALRRIDEARDLTPSHRLPHLLLRRAHILAFLTRHEEAVEDLKAAVAGFRALHDTLWEGRAWNNLSQSHLGLGDVDAAEADALSAERLLTSIGQHFEATQAAHNRALVAHARGDLAAALALLDEVGERYVALDNVQPDLALDRVQALLTAGLIDEARDACTEALRKHDVAPVRRAELLLALAQAALAQGDTAAAGASATEAAGLFATQLRPEWVDRAELLRIRAEHVADFPELKPWMLDVSAAQALTPGELARRSARLLPAATKLVASMEARGSPDLPLALLLKGRIARAAGEDAAARRSFAAAADARRTGPPLSRAAGWLAAALLADQRRDRRALYAACRYGLGAVDEHRDSLGDLELRALAGGHGIELALLAAAEAVRSGRARDLLWWTERWRAAALNGAQARPGDPALQRDLAALRDVTRRLQTLGDSDPGASELARERARLETAIRRANRHARVDRPDSEPRDAGRRRRPRDAGLDLDAVFTELGDHAVLLALVNVGDTLHLVTVRDGRVRGSVIGATESATKEAEFARFTLRRAAHGRPTDLRSTGQLLQAALLGAVAADLDRQPVKRVVVVPPAHLLTAPWTLLPALRDKVVTVSPSVSQWVRARRSPTASQDRVALVTGPNLTTREAEVAGLSRIHPRATVLKSDEATAAAALEALDGASLAHVAAHGLFRADAPLFSSLQLADGPLTVHDLQTLGQPPRSIVLSACDSGGAAPLDSYEALGLVSSLLGMGTASVLASVVPVNDQACLDVMANVHETVHRGGTLAEGALAARLAATDPLQAATAAAFTPWGA